MGKVHVLAAMCAADRLCLSGVLKTENESSGYGTLYVRENISRTSVFYRFIEREAQDNERIPDEDIRELLIMIEERRRGYFQNVATLASGLAGGLIGAIFGASPYVCIE